MDKGGQTVERRTKVGRRWRDGQRWADRGENKNRWGDRGRTVGSRPRVPVMISRGAKYRCLLYIRWFKEGWKYICRFVNKLEFLFLFGYFKN